jgi:predicted  nucleic acid-binding Zn-ribbon protein
MSDRQADSDAGQWMSYAQLAEIRGITKKAAQRLTLRHQWRRQPANDGGVLVWVPEDAAAPGRQTGGQTVRRDGGSDTLMAGALAALEDAVAALRDQLDVANARAERAEADRADGRQQADDLRAQIEVLNAEIVVMRDKADRALAEERHRADRAEAAIVAAASDVRELRSHAAALQVELADRQAALDRTQADAEAARERAADLQAGQELMMDMHARALAALQGDLDMARAQATTAHDALKAVRQAQAERKGRGLLARLRAAVRGE